MAPEGGRDGRCRVCASGDVRLFCRKDAARYLKCRACGLIFLETLPARERMRDHADDLYETGVYSDYVEAKGLKLEHFRRRLAQFGDRHPHGRLLDIGCSCGYFLEVALENGYDAAGIEFSRAAIDAADPQVRRRITRGNVNDLSSLGAEQYDIVTAFDIIEHTEDPVDFLRQARRLLKKGGCVVISTPDNGHFLRYLLGCRWPMLQPLQHTVLFSRKSLALCLELAGFSGSTFETAYKVVSLDYLFDQVREYFPTTHKAYRFLSRGVRGGLLRKPRTLNIGEMLAVGSPAGALGRTLR